jgi:hypothetical protein
MKTVWLFQKWREIDAIALCCFIQRRSQRIKARLHHSPSARNDGVEWLHGMINKDNKSSIVLGR